MAPAAAQPTPVLEAGDVTEQARMLIAELARRFNAEVEVSAVSPDVVETRVGPIALDTAQDERDPLPINSAFRGVVVEQATDQTTYVYLKPNDRRSLNGYIKLGQNSQRDYGRGIKGGCLHWPAQAGKTITLVFYSHGTYSNGQIVSTNAGGISINSGSAVAAAVQVNVGAVAVFIPQNTSRKQARWQNKGDAPIYVGGAGVTPATGIQYDPGQGDTWQNTAALYACSDGGAVPAIYVEET